MRRAILLALILSCCVPAPEDPLDFGVLCSDGTDACPASVVLEREGSGRNQFDYVVRNVGSATAVVEVLALVPSAPLDGGSTEIDPDDLVARREHDPLGPGDVTDNRFTAQELGVRDSFRVAVRCPGCAVELDWVYASVPRECFEPDDCPGGWQCDENVGRCAECLVSADCNEDQRCNTETGRCDPPDTTAGCSTAGPRALWPLLLVLALAALRRRPTFAALLLIAMWPAGADASGPRASVAVGAGARVLSGALGPVTKRGVGLSVQQELRWRNLGGALALGTSYFLTTQEPPPFSRSFQTYGVTIGPRVYVPIRFFELVAGADYRRLGTANNSLVRLTGTRTSFDGVGGIAGARLRWQGLELRLESGGHYIVQLDTVMISADLGVGFTNTQ